MAEEQSYFLYRPASYFTIYPQVPQWSDALATTFYKFPLLSKWLKPKIFRFAATTYLGPRHLNFIAATTGDADIGNQADGLKRRFQNGMENRFGGALSYHVYSWDKDRSPLWTCRLYRKVAFEELDKRGRSVGKYWTVRCSTSDAAYDSSDRKSVV